MNGIKSLHLFNAIANLEHGSIDCLGFSDRSITPCMLV